MRRIARKKPNLWIDGGERGENARTLFTESLEGRGRILGVIKRGHSIREKKKRSGRSPRCKVLKSMTEGGKKGVRESRSIVSTAIGKRESTSQEEKVRVLSQGEKHSSWG